jgi:hypothetical protein
MEQGSPEWLKVRLGIPTASRFKCITDVRVRGKLDEELAARRDYRYELALERLTGISIDSYVSEDMENGTIREPLARDAYMAATGELVHQVGFVRETEPDCGGSPDGLVGAIGGVEIKCPKASTHALYLFDPEAPKKYIPQCQGNIWLNDREWFDFTSFHPDYPEHLRLAIRRVWRDEKYIAGLQVALSIFNAEVAELTEKLRNHVEVLP